MSALFLVIEGSPVRQFYDGDVSVPAVVPYATAPIYPLLVSVTPLRAAAALDQTAEAVNLTVVLRNDAGQISQLFGGTVGGFQIVPPLAAVAKVYRVESVAAALRFTGTVKSISFGAAAQLVLVA